MLLLYLFMWLEIVVIVLEGMLNLNNFDALVSIMAAFTSFAFVV